MIKSFAPFAILFSILYFLVLELPDIDEQNRLQNEQRRLLLLELLTKENTPNRIREEAFVKLIEDYREKDFSGLQLTNLAEGYKTPFRFFKCFEKFENYSIDQDTIVRISFNPKKKNYKKIIILTKFNFWNTNLQYADFSATTQKRIYDDAKWLIYDELGTYDYAFVFEYLVDTNLSFADLTDATFEKANLENVDFSNATLENTNFKKAVFSQCKLNGAGFRGANLDSAVFDQTGISETTDFAAVQNYVTIRLASPYIVHMIKRTHYFDKEIQRWNYNWQRIDSSANPLLVQKWHLWNRLEQLDPSSIVVKYQEIIKEKYISIQGQEYPWKREL